jgi:hypothetical protein
LIGRFVTLEGMRIKSVTLIHHLTIMVTSAIPGLEAGLVAVAATLSKGYDLGSMRPQLPIDGFGSPSMGRGERLELEAADVPSPFEQWGVLIATPAGARVRWSRGTVPRDT